MDVFQCYGAYVSSTEPRDRPLRGRVTANSPIKVAARHVFTIIDGALWFSDESGELTIVNSPASVSFEPGERLHYGIETHPFSYSCVIGPAEMIEGGWAPEASWTGGGLPQPESYDVFLDPPERVPYHE